MKKYAWILCSAVLVWLPHFSFASGNKVITKDLDDSDLVVAQHKQPAKIKTLDHSDNDRFSVYEQELQRLIGRVEILERQLSTLSQHLPSKHAEVVGAGSTNSVGENNQRQLSDPKLDESLGQHNATKQKQSLDKNENDGKDSDTHISGEEGLANKGDVNNSSVQSVASESKQNPSTQSTVHNALNDSSQNAVSDKQVYEAALATLKEAGAIKDSEAKLAKLQDAEEKFNTFMEKFPKSKFSSSAMFWVGETYYHRQDYNKAAVNYLKSYKASKEIKGGNTKASDALLKLSLSLGELKKYKDACGMIYKLEQEFPKRPDDSVKRTNDAKAKFGCSKILAQ